MCSTNVCKSGSIRGSLPSVRAETVSNPFTPPIWGGFGCHRRTRLAIALIFGQHIGAYGRHRPTQSRPHPWATAATPARERAPRHGISAQTPRPSSGGRPHHLRRSSTPVATAEFGGPQQGGVREGPSRARTTSPCVGYPNSASAHCRPASTVGGSDRARVAASDRRRALPPPHGDTPRLRQMSCD